MMVDAAGRRPSVIQKSPLRVDLEAVRDVAVGQGVDDRLLAVGRAAHDAQRVGLDPDDRAVGLGDDAVRIDVVELLEDLGGAVLLDDADAAGMRLVDLVPVAGIGEVEPAVGAEGEVVRRRRTSCRRPRSTTISTLPSGERRWIDGGRVLGRDPRADGRALGRVDVAVRAEHAGVRAAADEGVRPLLLGLRIPDADLARIGVGEDDPAVVQHVGPFGMAKARRADRHRFLHGFLPMVAALTTFTIPPVKFSAWPVMYAASSESRNQIDAGAFVGDGAASSGTALLRCALQALRPRCRGSSRRRRAHAPASAVR